jgi:DNA-binding NarL/FixJ family response regulator
MSYQPSLKCESSIIRVLIADDQRSVTCSLQNLLLDEPDINVVGLAENGRIALEQVVQLQPDIVLVDLNMPIMDGLTTIQQLAQHFPTIKPIVITSNDEASSVKEALQIGARGYVLKSRFAEDLVPTIHAVSRNHVLLQADLLTKVISAPSNITASAEPILVSPSRVVDWSNWIAQSIIEYWRHDESAAHLSVDEILDELGLTTTHADPRLLLDLAEWSSGTTIHTQLDLKIQVIEQQLEQEKLNRLELKTRLEQEALLLDEWYKKPVQLIPKNHLMPATEDRGCQAQLQANANQLHIYTENLFEKLLTQLWNEVGPMPLLALLRTLQEKLENIIETYTQKIQEYSHTKDSAARAFSILCAQLVVKEISTDKPLKALRIAFESRIEVEVHTNASMIASALIGRLQEYQQTLLQTDILLDQLQELFGCADEKQSKTTITAILKYLTDQINTAEIKQTLEHQVRDVLNNWGAIESLDISSLRSQLLAHIEPTVQQLYQECCYSIFGLASDNCDRAEANGSHQALLMPGNIS